MNQNYFEPNPSYDSNYSGFDQARTYSCALYGNDHHYGSDCLPRFSLQDLNMKLNSDELMNELFKDMQSVFEEYRQREQAANLSTHTPEPSRRFNYICYDDDDDYDYEERTVPLNEIISQIPPSIVITTSSPVLPIEDPKDSLKIRNEDLSTIPKKESNKFIKSCVEDLVLIPNVLEEKDVTFSNPLFNSNDDFTYNDDESLSDEGVTDDKVKIYLNPLLEFDDEYISSDVNPLIDEVLEKIECKDSYDPNLDELNLLVTPLFDANKAECFNSGGDDDEINVLDYEDSYYE
nr:hypothetical protein [Tanacetum cinerariifolium]